MSKFLRIAVPIAAAALAAGCSNNFTVYALSSGSIIQFSTSTPDTINSTVTITGLNAGESVVQLSYQPSSGTLYCITSDGYLCTVDPSTGVAALVSAGSPFTENLGGGDNTVLLTNPVAAFDPVFGDLRVISDGSTVAGTPGDSYNLLVNPDGALDGGPVDATYLTQSLTYSSGSSGTPDVVGIAYSDAVEGATSTTLYGIDANTASLVEIGQDSTTPLSADGGVVTVVGALGVTLSSSTGFAIDPSSGTGYASLQPNGGAATLYSIDLSTGAATELGAIGSGTLAVNSLVILPGE